MSIQVATLIKELFRSNFFRIDNYQAVIDTPPNTLLIDKDININDNFCTFLFKDTYQSKLISPFVLLTRNGGVLANSFMRVKLTKNSKEEDISVTNKKKRYTHEKNHIIIYQDLTDKNIIYQNNLIPENNNTNIVDENSDSCLNKGVRMSKEVNSNNGNYIQFSSEMKKPNLKNKRRKILNSDDGAVPSTSSGITDENRSKNLKERIARGIMKRNWQKLFSKS